MNYNCVGACLRRLRIEPGRFSCKGLIMLYKTPQCADHTCRVGGVSRSIFIRCSVQETTSEDIPHPDFACPHRMHFGGSWAPCRPPGFPNRATSQCGNVTRRRFPKCTCRCVCVCPRLGMPRARVLPPFLPGSCQRWPSLSRAIIWRRREDTSFHCLQHLYVHASTSVATYNLRPFAMAVAVAVAMSEPVGGHLLPLLQRLAYAVGGDVPSSPSILPCPTRRGHNGRGGRMMRNPYRGIRVGEGERVARAGISRWLLVTDRPSANCIALLILHGGLRGL